MAIDTILKCITCSCFCACWLQISDKEFYILHNISILGGLVLNMADFRDHVSFKAYFYKFQCFLVSDNKNVGKCTWNQNW